MTRRTGRLAAMLLWTILAGGGVAEARTLEVGQGRAYAAPSAAVAAAVDGDRIVIAPGTYFDCAVLHQNRLTVEGSDPRGGAVLTDKTCEGKGILVTTGAGIVLRNLTLTRARVPDGNGAGIRDESPDLVVDHLHIVNNQNGILTGAPESATLLVRGSEFLRNGACQGACAHGIYAGHIALLRIEGSRFFDTREAHHVKSRAARTEILGCDIADGASGTASYLVDIPNGGALVLRGSTLQKGPASQNHTAAVILGEEGVTQPTPEITVEGNTFRAEGGYDTVFVDNITATEARLRGNTVTGATPLKGDGDVR